MTVQAVLLIPPDGDPAARRRARRAPVSGRLGPSSLVYLCALLVEPWLLGSTLVVPRSRVLGVFPSLPFALTQKDR